MIAFGVQFLICNIIITIIGGFFLLAKHLLRNHLSARMQYNLWFLFLGLLFIPFLPLEGAFFLPSLFVAISELPVSNIFSMNLLDSNGFHSMTWMQDFTSSITRETPSIISLCLVMCWLLGIGFMGIFTLRSFLRLRYASHTSLPVLQPKISDLYRSCLQESGYQKQIPLMSNAVFRTPVMAGVWKPTVYLPTHLLDTHNLTALRYMLLHELQHCKYKDALVISVMNLIRIIYWFNPFLWYALKIMCIDREVACDTSVLRILPPSEHIAYGNTLLNFAQRTAVPSLSFVSGISGNKNQLKHRIMNIVAYRQFSFGKKVRGYTLCILIGSLLIYTLLPSLSIYASDLDSFHFTQAAEPIIDTSVSSYFEGYEGSFVLYDTATDTWQIYNEDFASKRISPYSTYKVYDALLALDLGIITPEESTLPWNGEPYYYEAWNNDQTLRSAMENSVTWYFQELDQKIGATSISTYLQKLNYGNEAVHGDLASYWMDGLKISAIEQVQLLQRWQTNQLPFKDENTLTVKDSILLSSSDSGSLYGKTGTGMLTDETSTGWFIGFLEKENQTYYFATNIQDSNTAKGSTAAQITLSILSDFGIWE